MASAGTVLESGVVPDLKPEHIKEYHVFLGSPGDMNAERQAVHDFFDEYNRTTARPWGVRFTVIDWENYSTAGVGRPQELITQQTLERYTNSLALVIGLMGQRFGSPTGTHESGTEEEFEWALQHHLETGWPEIKWFFRKIDKFEAPPDPAKIDEAKAQWEKVRRFRRKLQEPGPRQLYYKGFTDLINFREVLRQDLALWLGDPQRPWSVAKAADAGAVIPPDIEALALHQLPSPPRDFTGREAEIDELMGRIEEGGVTISGMHGLAGIGKTALALVLADRLQQRYPDAQFYLELKGTDPKPLMATEAMAHAIRSYRPQERLPESEGELRAIYNAVLHDKRALLLMDNAADAKQVEPLIPPESCLLLVTSRQHFTLPGLYARNLDTLPPDDARELLLKIAPRIGNHADKIARLCGYLPLALRLAGSALAVRPDLSPGDYARRLADEHKRLETLDRLATDSSPGIEASIRASEALLPEDLRQLWHALGVFPGDFDEAAAVAVWAIPEEQGRDALSELVRYSLVDFRERVGRWRLHDLFRLFVQTRMTGADGDVTFERHAQHFRTILERTDDLCFKSGKWSEGLDLFDREWENVRAGQRWAQGAGDKSTAANRHCMLYPHVGANILLLRQKCVDRIRWLEAGLEAVRRRREQQSKGERECGPVQQEPPGDKPLAAIAADELMLAFSDINCIESMELGNLGTAYLDAGQPSRAIERYEQAIGLLPEAELQTKLQAIVLCQFGSAHYVLGALDQARRRYEEALTVAEKIGHRRTQAMALNNLGNVHDVMGETDKAGHYYERSLNIAREVADPQYEANSLMNLGALWLRRGQPSRSISPLDEALAIYHRIDDRRGEGGVLGNLGLAYAELGDPERAIEYYEKALAVSRETGDRRGQAITSWNLGREYAKQDVLARAVELMQVRVDYEREIDHADAEKDAAIVDQLRVRLKGLTASGTGWD